MYTGINEAFNTAMKKLGGRTFRARLTVGEAVYEDTVGTVQYKGGSNSETTVSIGTAVSAYLDIEMFGDNTITAGTEFLCEFGIKLEDGSFEFCPMGYFIAESQTRDNDKTKIRAYDRMSKLEAGYFSELQYPCATTDVMAEIVSISGYEFATTIEPITMTAPDTGETQVFADCTMREAVGYVAGLYGMFATFNRLGQLEFRWYEDSGLTVNADRIWSLETSDKDITINRVILRRPGGAKFGAGSGEEVLDYTNPHATPDIADLVYATVGGFSYRPAEAKVLGDCRLDAWDVITVQDSAGAEYKVPLMGITHTLDGGLATTVTATGDYSEQSDVYKGPITKRLERLDSDLLKVRFISQDVEKKMASLEMDVDGIRTSVSKKVGNDEVISSINQSAESVKIEAKNINLNGVVTANDKFKINEDGSMEAIAGEIGGWQITENAIFKDVRAFIQPGLAEMERIEELMLDKSWTAQELEWYDYNRDGTLDVRDILAIKRMLIKIITIDDLVSQYGYVKPIFDARISLSTSDYQRALKIETNAYGRAIVRYFGLDGMESTTGVFDGALVHDLRTQVMSCEGDANFGRDLYCAGNIHVDGDLMDFSLNNSSYTFDMSGYSGHVYDIVVWGDYGCAYATIVLSLHTLSIATNGSSWTGPGNIKIQQTSDKEISFTYDATSTEVLFHSKIVERY